MVWKSVAVVAAVIAVAVVYQRVSVVLGKDTIHAPTTAPSAESPLKFTMKDIDGHDVRLADYKGKVVMIVNVASRCGFTPQYEGLEALYRGYKDKGFVVLGFPANNFGGQEPGTEADIKAFCTGKYDVTFPMFSKISVKGADQHPLYQYLTGKPTDGDFAGDIGWNFTKFLVGKNGQVYARFASNTKPQDPTLIAAVEKGLGE